MSRALLLLLCLVACEKRSQPQPRAALGDALARVDGHEIGRAEVERLARAAAISPAEALHDLVSERLLVAHALRGGYGALASVKRAHAQALVRALLARELGEGVQTDPIRIEAQRAQLDSLLTRLRAQTHVRYDESAIARAFAPAAAP